MTINPRKTKDDNSNLISSIKIAKSKPPFDEVLTIKPNSHHESRAGFSQPDLFECHIEVTDLKISKKNCNNLKTALLTPFNI